MRLGIELALAGAVLAVTAGAVGAGPIAEKAAANATPEEATATERKQAEHWIEQLGDPSFAVRDRAADRLAGMQLKACKPLMAALKHRDAHVRREARNLLEQALEADFRRRLKLFEVDSGDNDYGLPGWERFRDRVGADPQSRQVYIEMVKADAALLEALAAGGDEAREAVEMRFQRLVTHWVESQSLEDSEWLQPPTLASMAAVIFAMSDPVFRERRSALENEFNPGMLFQGPIVKALEEGKIPAYRRLAGLWVKEPTTRNGAMQKLDLAVKYGIAEGAALAWSLLKDEKTSVQAAVEVRSLIAIGYLGGKDYVRALNEFTENKRAISNDPANRNTKTCQLRDIALAWSLHLLGEDLSAYGMDAFAKSFQTLRDNKPTNIQSLIVVGYITDETRNAAFAKWRDYLAKHDLPALPKIEKISFLPLEISEPQPAADLRNYAGQEKATALGLRAGMADSLRVKSLQDGQQLCADKRYLEGVRVLDAILAVEDDAALQPIAKRSLYVRLQAEAERSLRALPREGVVAYRAQCEATARAALRRAIQQGNSEGIRAVADRFALTESGAVASYLAASHHMNRGEWLCAAWRLGQVRRLPDAALFEPALSLRRGLCWLKAGFPDEADAVMRQLTAADLKLPITVAGETRDGFARSADAMRLIESLAGRDPSNAFAADWLLAAGDAKRNRIAAADMPYLRAAPLANVVNIAPLCSAVDAASAKAKKDGRVTLPQLSPLVVGSTIVLRSATHLQAYDFGTGRLLWQSALDDSLRRLICSRSEETDVQLSDELVMELTQRLWTDSRFGALSSDGQSVFGVEGVSLGMDLECSVRRVDPDGRRRIRTRGSLQNNLLTSYDVATGKLNWELGGPTSDGRQLAGARFQSPPLPLAGRLYVCATVGTETRLHELDARSGAELGSIALPVPPQESEGEVDVHAFQQVDVARTLGQTGPAFAEGTLVCQLGEAFFVAINLATRSVRWSYEASRNRATQAEMSANLGLPTDDRKRQEEWAGNGIVIADGRVLLTQAVSSELVCLSLADGHFEWAVSQPGGLYVGGVNKGRVLIVSRRTVSALNLSDGKPAWPQGHLSLPAKVLPCGRGVLTDDTYYLPVDSGDILVISLSCGEIVGVSKSAGGLAAGNLVVAHGAILSQSDRQVCRFASLSERHQQLLAVLKERPDEASLLREYGQVLLSLGRVPESIDTLSKSLATQSDKETRHLLVEAVSVGLRKDFGQFRARAKQVEFDSLTAEQGNELRHVWAEGLLAAGECTAAFEIYVKMIDPKRDAATTFLAETQREVRRDHWLAARLAEVYRAAPAAQRSAIEALIAAQLTDALCATRLPYFDWHPTASNVRLRHAAKLNPEDNALRIEQLLRDVWERGDAAQQREAVARLAQLAVACNRPLDAAPYYRMLRGPLADEICLEGRTGAQLVAALPTNSPVRAAIDGPKQWPRGTVTVESSPKPPKRTTPASNTQTIPCIGMDPLLDDAMSCHFEQGSRSLTAIDGAVRSRWQVSLKAEPGFGHKDMSICFPLCRRGSLAIGWLGPHVCAFDTTSSEARIAWRQGAYRSKNHQLNAPLAAMRAFAARQGGTAMPAAELPPMWFTSGGVCLLRDYELLVLDPLDGQVLWRRTDIEPDSSLFGDSEMLFVTPIDGTQAQVFSMRDGRLLGRREVPKVSQWFWIRDRFVAAWIGEEDKRELAVVDPWIEKTVWQRAFDAKAQPCLIEGDELAVLDGGGHFVVLDLVSGIERLAGDIDMPESFDRLMVQRTVEQYVVLAGALTAEANRGWARRDFSITGQLAAFDRHGGKRQWVVPVAKKPNFNQYEFGDLPILVFHGQTIGERKLGARTVPIARETLAIIDKRDGKLLSEQTSNPEVGSRLEVEVDRGKRQIEVRCGTGGKRLIFAESDGKPDKTP